MKVTASCVYWVHAEAAWRGALAPPIWLYICVTPRVVQRASADTHSHRGECMKLRESRHTWREALNRCSPGHSCRRAGSQPSAGLISRHSRSESVSAVCAPVELSEGSSCVLSCV